MLKYQKYMELKELINELIASSMLDDNLIAISFIDDDDLSPEEKVEYIEDLLKRNAIISPTQINNQQISERSREILYALSDYFVKNRVKKI